MNQDDLDRLLGRQQRLERERATPYREALRHIEELKSLLWQGKKGTSIKTRLARLVAAAEAYADLHDQAVEAREAYRAATKEEL